MLDGNELALKLTKQTITEIRRGWQNRDGQGNDQARSMGNHCVLIKCRKDDALLLSELFYRQFAIRSCCWYNGKTLSLYCGDASRGADDLEWSVTKAVEGYFAGKTNCD